MSGNKIAVVAPVYNREAEVVRLLDSVARQTRPADDIVIVDDGSEDGTAAAVAQWLAAHPEAPARLLRQANHGAAHARNAGLRAAAASDFVLFADSDDVLPPDFLARTAPALAADARAALVSTDQRFESPGEAARLRALEGITRDPETWLFLCGAGVASCTLLRTRAVLAVGGFDERLYTGHDVPFFAQLARAGEWRHAPGAPVVMHRDENRRFNLYSFCRDAWRRWAFIFEQLWEDGGGTRTRLSDKRWRNIGGRWQTAGEEQLAQHCHRAALECFARALWWTPYRWRAARGAGQAVWRGLRAAVRP